jgi:hypothetical protein
MMMWKVRGNETAVADISANTGSQCDRDAVLGGTIKGTPCLTIVRDELTKATAGVTLVAQFIRRVLDRDS